MITVAGETFDIDAVIDRYPAGSVEGMVLRTMANSTGQYAYGTLAQLEFELAMRREIVNAARGLNRSGMDFAVFHKSRRNPQYWDRTSNGGFRLKEGVSPSDAIMDIYKNGSKYATECATAMMMVYYRALISLYGAERFDMLFPNIYLMNWSQIDPRLKEVGEPRKVTDKLIGDRAYFANPDVDPKTPEWQGENVIIMPDNLYYGHGVGITTAERIIRGLNASRKKDATRSAYFRDEVSRPDFKELAGLYQEPVSEALLPMRYVLTPVWG